MSELFKRDGKWLTREQLWEYNKKKETKFKPELIKEPDNEPTKEPKKDINEVIEVKEEDMAKCKSKKKSKK